MALEQTPRESRRISGPGSVTTTATPRRDDQPPAEWPVWALKMRHEYESELNQLKTKLADMESSIMATARQRNEVATIDRRVSLYGNEQVLQEMTMQVALCPKFDGLKPAHQRYVAMVGLLTGLTPEFYLHAWINKKKTKNDVTGQWEEKEILTVMPDYKALIIRSKPLMEKVRRLTVDEMKARGISDQDIEDGSIAYVVEGHELDQAIKCRAAGIGYEPKTGFGWWAAMKDGVDWDAPKVNGKHPVKRIANDIPNGRDGAWVAEKRARRDLYYKFADLTINLPHIVGGDVVEGEYVFEGDTPPMIINGQSSPAEPAEWLTPDAIKRAESYRAELGVTDDQINNRLMITDWRRTSITPDEFKIVVEQIALLNQFNNAPDVAITEDGEVIDTAPAPAPWGATVVDKERRKIHAKLKEVAVSYETLKARLGVEHLTDVQDETVFWLMVDTLAQECVECGGQRTINPVDSRLCDDCAAKVQRLGTEQPAEMFDASDPAGALDL